jgi:hypothetical protein
MSEVTLRRMKVAASQNSNRRLIACRLRELDINFLLTLIDWNQESGQHFGSKDRWEHKRKHIRALLQGALAS